MSPSNAGAAAMPTVFQHGSSEVIFHNSLLAPVSHLHWLAEALVLCVLSSSALLFVIILFVSDYKSSFPFLSSEKK